MITLTYEELFSFENLYKAHISGRSGKRSKKPVVRFEIGTLIRIYNLYDELQRGSYRLSKY